MARAGVTPTAAAATSAYVALSTDTGDFRYSNATGRAFRAAAEMVDAGAQPPRVANWVHNNRSLASVKLLGEALRTKLQRFVISADGWDENLRANRCPERRSPSTGTTTRDPGPDVELL